MKFGGSSVQNAAMIRRVLTIVTDALPRAPVLVSSAMGKTTDALVDIAAAATAGDWDAAVARIDQIESSHRQAAEELALATTPVSAQLDALFDELRSLAQGVFLIRECSPRSRDALLSFGERLSTAIIAAAATVTGIDTTLVDARRMVRTDANFGGAAPVVEETNRLVRSAVAPAPGHLVVTQGFIGATEEGVTTTLGRGGSDYSATLIGAALDADVVEIWTDVSGIMTADPRVIPEAVSIATISYDEAAELAYFGAKVVHPSTILPAVDRGIPVLVRNTMQPDALGTRIHTGVPSSGVRAIASKSSVTLITVRSSRMLNAFGFLHALFEVFDAHRVSVDLVATSEVSVSMTVDRDAPVGRLLGDLERLGEVSIEHGKSIVCLVGRGLLQDAAFLSDVFGCVAPSPVRMIALGSSDINLSLVVSDEHAQSVLRSLHAHLFGPSDNSASA
ncbi:MAG: lysine-sensitive aspartokinase 3 [Spirochaetaceae bacterium]|nr:MAG: lysine-sensitive aspartokinase 3 [Spirochaetaceae bacterium]